MINLDQPSHFKELDTQNMLGEIDGLPDQLKSAWELGQTMPLPDAKNIQRVVIAGMGGSAIGADLVAAAVSQSCSCQFLSTAIMVCLRLQKDKETLVILSSHSGNTGRDFRFV